MLVLVNVRIYLVENVIGSLGKIIIVICKINDLSKLKLLWLVI